MNSQPFLQTLRQAVPRGLALFFGTFALANFLLSMKSRYWDATVLWLDLRGLPVWLVQPLLFISAMTLICFGLCWPRSTWQRFLTAACAALLSSVALFNSVKFYVLLAKGQFHTVLPVPLSLAIAIALLSIFHAALQPRWLKAEPQRLVPVLTIAGACALLFPLALMVCFGLSNYEKPADAVVVFGARAYADGRASDALADRVRTACDLYRRGEARKLIMSGGPGDGAHHETEVMKQLAIQWGVRAEDILVDEHGWSTQDTVRNTDLMIRRLGRLGAKRVLVVSHFYHLPRIKLAYQQAGLQVRTVPAKERRLLGQLPYNMARETAAFWSYYLKLKA